MRRPATIAISLLISATSACNDTVAGPLGTTLEPGGHVGGPIDAGLPVETRRLEVSIHGPGRVLSTPAGINCRRDEAGVVSGRCVARLAVGVDVMLLAEGSADHLFVRWFGPCAGSGTCVVALANDESVTAGFVEGPPPDASHRLTLEIVGQGTVSAGMLAGWWPGNDACSASCTMSVRDRFSLWAFADPRWRFREWRGPCAASSATSCAATTDGDLRVTAVFEPLPPLPSPPAACAALLPSLGDAIEAALPSAAGCHFAPPNEPGRLPTSDGRGTFALTLEGMGYTSGRFVQVGDGGARAVGHFAGAWFELFPQQSGFLEQILTERGNHRIHAYDEAFEARTVETIVCGEACETTTAGRVAADPEGGLAVARLTTVTPSLWRLELRRLAPDGAPEYDWRELGLVGELRTIGFASGGRLLVVTRPEGADRLEARWYGRDAAPLTDAFELDRPVQSSDLRSLGDDVVLPTMTGLATLSAGSTRLVDAPAWLAHRADANVVPIRGDRGFAVTGSPECRGALELLTSDGDSCGCLEDPRLPRSSLAGPWVGRDGSLIVTRGTQFEHCVYELHPRVFE